MSLVDSHCHLNMLEGDLSTIIDSAKEVGVETILCVGVDLENSQGAIAIAERFPQVWASVGLHPSHKIESETAKQEYLNLAKNKKVVAIGETGLDYYYNKEGLDEMRESFRSQIRLARELNKPLIIHTRDAREDTLKIMREERATEVGGVMHCFTESLEMAEAAMELGFYISFSGIVTFNKAENVAAVAKQIPLERMLIETDAPYLTPVPFRGKPNQPQYVRFVAQRIAELKNCAVELVAQKTTENFYNLFKCQRPT